MSNTTWKLFSRKHTHIHRTKGAKIWIIFFFFVWILITSRSRESLFIWIIFGSNRKALGCAYNSKEIVLLYDMVERCTRNICRFHLIHTAFTNYFDCSKRHSYLLLFESVSKTILSCPWVDNLNFVTNAAHSLV